jgi:K+-sensing histidine kinase KdpD
MYEPLAEEAGASLTFEKAGSGFALNGHRQLLAQALSNLIENALNHGRSGKQVTVFTRRSGDRLSLGVRDRGAGIPADRRDQACQRFGRLDSSRSSGGAVTTASGLIFIAAATDDLLRAIDERTGKVVWSVPLPAGGQATPMIYQQNGREYLVIFAGGHHFMETPMGDSLIAYALPS